MNLLKKHIVKVYKEVPLNKLDWDDKNREWVHAYYRISCYGIEKNENMIYPIDEWEEIKERGYYLG